MSLNVNWSNPYADREGSWYCGNMHTHTTSGNSSCGVLPLETMIDLYAELGHDFLSLSDHMAVPELPDDDRLALIPGVEWNSPNGEHTGVFSTKRDILQKTLEVDDHDQLLKLLAEDEALVVLNHPNWQSVSHYRREQLDQKQGYDGIEIYNGVIERLQGYAISSDKWDYLLAQNRHVLGFAFDDAHAPEDVGNGWICARARERTPEAIMTAIRSGDFYCSSGVVLSDIRREGDTIIVESENAEEIQVIQNGGRRVLQTDLPSLEYDVSGLEGGYVRFAAYGYGSSMAWTQPFFME